MTHEAGTCLMQRGDPNYESRQSQLGLFLNNPSHEFNATWKAAFKTPTAICLPSVEALGKLSMAQAELAPTPGGI